MDFDFDYYKVQGVKVNYYYICKRKLWLFSKGITMENTSDRVLSGKLVHENSYPNEKNKEVNVDNLLKLDIVNQDYIREVKISSKMNKSDRMQLLYYIYYLKQKGIHKKGIINYVKERKREEIEMSDLDEKVIESTLINIKKVENMKIPPKLVRLTYCTKCAYYFFCFSDEVIKDE